MARTARKRSEGDIYHVIIRGVGQQIIFEDDEDRFKFLRLLDDAFTEENIIILAWCLMSNHVHLLLKAPIERISKSMMKLESMYAHYFNQTHGRSGVLFQGRYTSIPIEDDVQLLTAIRYIHMNPVKTLKKLDSPWSSYGEYIGKNKDAYCDRKFVLDIFGGIDAFKRFHEAEAEHSYSLPRQRISEKDALFIAREVLGKINLYDLRSMERTERDWYLAKLRKAGLSISQISRLTSIGRNIVSRAK